MPSIFDQFRLNGRTALVTGGSQGLGQKIATALSEAGASVVIVSRRLEACQAAAEAIQNETKRPAFGFAADVTDPRSVQRLYDEVTEKLGPIDVLLNSAGLNKRGPIATLSAEDWDSVVDAMQVAGMRIASK